MPILLLFLLTLNACSARGFRQESLRAADPGPAVVTHEGVREELARKAQLPKPFRLGIFWKDPVEGPAPDQSFRRWGAEEKKELLSLAEAFSASEVSASFPILTEVGAEPSLSAVRVAAARQGADAVLVVSGAQETFVDTNAAAFSYLLLLPTLFVKGNDAEARFLARAQLIDVRNGFLYLAAEGEALKHERKTLFGLDAGALLKVARTEALGALREELKRQAAPLMGAAL